MNQVMIDIWPYLMIPIAGAIGWLFREVFTLKSKGDVQETEIKGLKSDIDDMKNRLNSHSKKQDEIVQLITDLKVGFMKELGEVSVNMASMASNIDNLTNLIKVTDLGIKVDNSKSVRKKK